MVLAIAGFRARVGGVGFGSELPAPRSHVTELLRFDGRRTQPFDSALRRRIDPSHVDAAVAWVDDVDAVAPRVALDQASEGRVEAIA